MEIGSKSLSTLYGTFLYMSVFVTSGVVLIRSV